MRQEVRQYFVDEFIPKAMEYHGTTVDTYIMDSVEIRKYISMTEEFTRKKLQDNEKKFIGSIFRKGQTGVNRFDYIEPMTEREYFIVVDDLSGERKLRISYIDHRLIDMISDRLHEEGLGEVLYFRHTSEFNEDYEYLRYEHTLVYLDIEGEVHRFRMIHTF